jgi:hypothetical protein
MFDNFAPDLEEFSFWFGLAQNAISRCRVPFSYIDLVCSFSSKLENIKSLIRDYKDRWLIEFSWDNWSLLEIACALVSDLNMFNGFLWDYYSISTDVLFFIQNSSFAFGYLEWIIDMDLVELTRYFSRKDRRGWRIFESGATYDVLKCVSESSFCLEVFGVFPEIDDNLALYSIESSPCLCFNWNELGEFTFDDGSMARRKLSVLGTESLGWTCLYHPVFLLT